MMAKEERTWHEIVRGTLKTNSMPLVFYVPDNVLKPAGVRNDSYGFC
jgi:hypothetical protein